MSILQEYEEIRKQIGEDKYHAIDEYLTEYPQVYLSDIYYNEDEWNKFEEWYKARQLTPAYFKQKYSDLPHINEYVRVLSDADVSPYDIDKSLDIIKHNMDGTFLLATVGEDIADKLYKIKRGE